VIVGILLAAGRGRRFDPSGARDKLLEIVDGVPVALRALGSLAAHCDRVIAVTRPESARLIALLAAGGASVVRCGSADAGMGVTLAAGAAAMMRTGTRRHVGAGDAGDAGDAGGSGADIVPGADRVAAVVVLPADLPWLHPATVAQVVAALDRHDPDAIAAPVHRGQRGHPVVFGAGHLGRLARLEGDRGARDLLDVFPVVLVEVEDPGILRDVDTPEDLESG
jgi:molybdenum cofactor cytidylyltransferase